MQERLMSALYRDSQRSLQRRFDTERLANRIEERLVRDYINDEDRAFIERMDMFFLATANAAAEPSCSYKGGDPGFVRVIDPTTLVFPDYDGNGMFLSLGNVLENPQIGLLFIDFENRKRLRINGTAAIAPAAGQTDFPEALSVVTVKVRQVFPNCPRYIHKMQRIERSPFVPRPAMPTPVPGWKQAEWACDVLPAGDPARQRGHVENEKP
jgi:hypothetical protein